MRVWRNQGEPEGRGRPRTYTDSAHKTWGFLASFPNFATTPSARKIAMDRSIISLGQAVKREPDRVEGLYWVAPCSWYFYRLNGYSGNL